MAFTKINKDANTKVAMRFLVDCGWTPMQAAAIVGNLTAESYMNPRTPRGDQGTAMGLAQWRNERLTQFTKIIGKHCENASLKEQLRFVDWELRNTHKRAGKALVAATNLAEATHMVDKHYERSAGHHLDRRIKFATQALGMFQQEKMIDRASKNSMDASDPSSVTQPGNRTEPVPSSGYPLISPPLTLWERFKALIKN